MFTIHHFETEKPELGKRVLVQIDGENTVVATLHEREDKTLYWKMADTNITIMPNGNEMWVDESELWNLAASKVDGFGNQRIN